MPPFLWRDVAHINLSVSTVFLLHPRSGFAGGRDCVEVIEGLLSSSDELQIAASQIRRTFEDGNHAPISKAFIGTIFVEIESTFLLVVKEVEVLLGKFLLDRFLVLATRKGGRAIDAETIGIDF